MSKRTDSTPLHTSKRFCNQDAVDAVQQPPITTENPSESDEESSLFPSSDDEGCNGDGFDDDDILFDNAGEEDSSKK